MNLVRACPGNDVDLGSGESSHTALQYHCWVVARHGIVSLHELTQTESILEFGLHGLRCPFAEVGLGSLVQFHEGAFRVASLPDCHVGRMSFLH